MIIIPKEEAMTIDNFDADDYASKLREQGYRDDVIPDLIEKKKESLQKDESTFEYVMKLEEVGRTNDHIIVAGIASNGSLDWDEEAIDLDSLRSSWDDYMKNPVLRYMHGKDQRHPDAIGRVIPEHVTEDGKTLKTEFREGKPFIVAEISNAPDVKDIRVKIQEGVLKGFSIGGRANKVKDFCYKLGKDVNKIFVKRLSEISIVDLPANKEGFFEIVKGCVGDNCSCNINEEIMKGEDKRPPKAWFDNCVKTAKGIDGIDDPKAFCGWMYHHGGEEGFKPQKTAIGKNENYKNYDGIDREIPENENSEYIKLEDMENINMSDENIEMGIPELTELIKGTVSEMIADQDTLEKVEGYDAAIKAAQDLRARIAELEAKVTAMAAQLKAQPQETMKSEDEVKEDEVVKTETEDVVEDDRVAKLEAELKELKESPLYKAEQDGAVEKGEIVERVSHLGSIIKAHYGVE